MKAINVRDLQKKIRSCMNVAQKERVVVTRHGKPLAVVTGVEGYDWEDVSWATNAAFWREIQRRRQEPTLSLEEVCRRFKIPLPRKRKVRRHGA
jgi:prevent-host-death family protein